MTNANKWAALAKEISSSDGEIVFLQDGKTTIKLIAPPNAQEEFDTSWFVEFEQDYKGNKTKKYAVHAVDMRDKKVKVVILPKTVLSTIFTLMGEEHNLLGIDNGVPISIIRTKTSNKTEYTTMPTAKFYDSSEADVNEALSLGDAIARITKPKEESKEKETPEDEIEW